MPQALCTNERCSRSVVVKHANGNPNDNRASNRQVVGFKPPKNHELSVLCGVNPNWRQLPVLTQEQCEKA